MTVKPLLKWVGGKGQILDSVLDKFPRNMNNYYEPFIGGASVLLGLLQDPSITINGTVTVSDKNEKLIHFYRNVKNNPIKMNQFLVEIYENYNSLEFINTLVDRNPDSFDAAMTSQESYYYYIRNLFNSNNDYSTPLASAMFLFLNKTCFRGLYREGPNGFNVPFGNYTRLVYPMINEFSSIVQKRNVQFLHSSFEKILESKFDKCDFVYLDPPYLPKTLTSFVGYTSDGFGEDMHISLFTLIKGMDCRWVLSNSDSDIIQEWFGDAYTYTIETIECRRCINSKNPKSKVMEVIISTTTF